MKRTSEAVLAVLCLGLPAAAEPVAISVVATAETVGTRGDADDPAIWVNPADPQASLVLGTDKTQGLFVYGLDGAELQFFPDGELNNVDLRPFTLGGREVWLAGATKRDGEAIALYLIEEGKVRRAVPHLHDPVPGELAATVDDIYGFAMGQSGAETWVLVNYKSGHVVQWRVTAEGEEIGLEFVRLFAVESQPEGMLVDDVAGHVYIGEEDVGIWRFPLSPDAAPEPVAIDMIPSACLPRDDVEGLAIWDGGEARYLVASAQGIHRAAVYRLAGEAIPACVALVEIAAGAVDGVSETDGLDVTALPVGSDYPAGLLVMMDDQNAGFTTNFKLIGWEGILSQLP
jgi:3-phytase